MKKYILKLLMLAIPSLLYSQSSNFPPSTSTVQMPAFSTPEVSKLFRYSDFPNISAIGGTDIEIPIYTIKLDGLEIPIALKYDTKGVKVADIASDVGLGWNLIYGGNIVKEIKDTDDFLSTYFFFDPYCGGFEGYMSEKNYRISKGYLDDDYGLNGDVMDFQIDSSPDFYLVNAPGLNDKYYLKFDSNYYLVPQFLENKNSKADGVFISTTSVLNTRAANPYFVSGFENFKIKNGLGFEYSFNTPQGTAINFFPQSFDDNINLYPASVNTWRLGQIKSPYSYKSVNYVFESFTNTYLNPTLNIPNQGSDIPDGDGGRFATGSSPSNSGGGGGGAKIISTYNLNNKRIKAINFDDGSINFTYTTQRLDYDGNVLSKIEIVNKSGQLVKSYDLTYSYFLPASSSSCTDNYNCLRLRLDSVTDSSSGNYSFTYGTNNSNGVFPKRTSSKIDFLGFFNNNNSDIQFFTSPQQVQNPSLFPEDKIYYYSQLEKDNYLPFQLNNVTATSQRGTVDRSSNENSLIGLLTQVTYPTGGRLSVQYENDDFDYMGMTYKLGTARIKKFTQNFNNGNTLEKNYSYKLDDGKSSGQIAFFNINRPKIGLEINSTAYILYSKVEEAITGNGNIINEYSNFNEYPDLLEKYTFPNNATYITSAELKTLKDTKFPSINIMSQKHRRGLLVQKTIKDNSGSIVTRELFQYKNYTKDSLAVNKLISNYQGDVTGPCGGIWGLKYAVNTKNYIKTENSFLTKVIKESYFGSNVVTEESNYTYNEPNNVLTVNQKIVSDGKITETNYQYPNDLGKSYLTNKNIIELPLITTSKLKNSISDLGKMISKVETIYPITTGSVAGSYVLPLSSKSYNLDNTQQIDITYDKYDNRGNLLQYTKSDNVPVSFIYGYFDTYPLVKIEGVTYDTLMSEVFGWVSNPEANTAPPFVIHSYAPVTATSQQNILTSLDEFRKHNYVKNFKITTYTYDPLIGVTSITPPSGIREVYLYDSANRLKEIRENSSTGKILKEFKYNYKP
ncbi:RHS repeat domain-containing protein [Chryseobacterium wangxinyae]|uniref:hypothetical protein n=1 Tax=Chryseobacterium sp. CY353 TaxID=2997334 RepID=UPI002270FBE7|nr:hypothetical protein [Chryseobacterium sp. CY353]MCY0968856.1 hypothetical protein [Chryseobacterium sp. CY353]